MKKYTISCLLLIFSVVLSSCSENNIKLSYIENSASYPTSIVNYFKPPYESCLKVYASTEFWILEQHCQNPKYKKGIYALEEGEIQYFKWYDPKFSEWANIEGCNTNTDCYYSVNLNGNGKIKELKYIYNINLSQGYYKLLRENDSLNIIDSLNTDIAS